MSTLTLVRALRRALIADDLYAIGRALLALRLVIGPAKSSALLGRLSRRFRRRRVE